MQTGNGSDQFPSGKHSRWFAPSRLYPTSQVWLTIEPNVVDVPIVSPLMGMPGSPQSITKNTSSNQPVSGL